MSFALTRHTGDLVQDAQRWADMDTSERKRRAIEACRDRDAVTLWDLTLSWLLLYGSAGAHVSPNTQEAYEYAVRLFCRETQAWSILHLTADNAAMLVRRWETQEVDGKRLAPSTVSVRLAGVRTLYKALRWSGAVTADPLADTKAAKDPTPAHEKRHPYEDAAIEKLLSAAGLEDRVLVLCGAHGGLRNAEILALTWNDIDLSARRLTVQCGKARKKRTVRLSRRLLSALIELQAQRPESTYVLSYRTTQQARNRLKALCVRAGVQWLSVHSLRHSAGTRIYEETGRLEDAQAHLGHANISTTQIYARYSDARLKKSVDDW